MMMMIAADTSIALLCARHCSKLFIYTKSSNPHNLMRWVLLLPPFYSQGNSRYKEIKQLNVIQVVSGRARI